MLNVKLLYDPAIPLLDVYSGEMEMYVHTEVYTLMLIAQQPKSGNNPNIHKLMSGLINMWYMYTMEYFLAIKRN